MTSEHEKHLIEELLNAYIDGELSERQCTELKRLIDHDEQAAKRLVKLQKCKSLLGSMPQAKAPDFLVKNVRTMLERRMLLSESSVHTSVKAGVFHLFTRRMIAAAAMLALTLLLGVMIYNVLKEPSKSVVAIKTDWNAATQNQVKASPTESALENIPAGVITKMNLELRTDQSMAVNAFVYRSVILDNELLEWATIDRQTDKSVYSLACTKEQMEVVFSDLRTIWDRFKSARLTIAAAATEVSVADITADQIIQLARQTSVPEQIKLAKGFASVNKLSSNQFAEAAAPSEGSVKIDIDISKPVLTTGEKKTSSPKKTSGQEVRLTITVIGI